MKKILIGGIAALVVVAAAVGGFFGYKKFESNRQEEAANKAATTYLNAFQKRQYDKLITVIDGNKLKGKGYHYTLKQVEARNQAVFDRVGADDIKIENKKVVRKNATTFTLSFDVKMATTVGPLTARGYETTVHQVGDQWQVVWNPQMLFPQMSGSATVQLTRTAATRGSILDRNGEALATNGTRVEAGLVRGQLGTGAAKTANLAKIADALDVTSDSLDKLLAQSWVTDDNFVPIKVVTAQPKLTGVTYENVAMRTYPTGAASAQLIGYVGEVSADDIKKDPQLAAGDEIGKTGLEQTYNSELAGKAGGELWIEDNGKTVQTLTSRKMVPGKNVQLTIDAAAQEKAYAQIKGKKGAVVTLDPTTGAVMTLVSAPSYDPNDFVAGISQADYDKLANNSAAPFSSRYLQGYAPGSTFKMVTAGVALDNGTITASTTRKISGLKWQKDSSWGDYKVTRVEDVASENMAQALAYSDNIWFAQAALEMGADKFTSGVSPFLKQGDTLPLTQQKAQLANDGLKREVLLADTAYGQGELLLTPIQQATAYTALVNGGKMTLPHLLESDKTQTKTVLTSASADQVKTALQSTVTDPAGTAHALTSLGHSIAAKTGTAELKEKQDTTGKTNGFLMAEDAASNKFLVLAMLEDSDSGAVVTAMTPYLASLY
ncbi:penicillin-binding protein PBP4(5) [Lacticaseibacillus mingshuiensis]|uniref:penicillin-binding protein PBP4(5) n=1 Tax=Lacticaseibacillus mingshuiensis TaxID=2799574 RepID=UPI00194FE957|nr:penicillin-binding transpeptidase domain-containing protein [Lacticaseibacillus mingshuiensis]